MTLQYIVSEIDEKRANKLHQWDFHNNFRFQPDKEFSGTDRNTRRDGPVQFERDEEDPFGLDKFLTEAKRAGKRTADEPRTSR